MKKKLKFTAVFLAAAAVISLLSGCQAAPYEAKYQLCNPNADENTQKIYDYICDNFGTNMISCQQESTWLEEGPDFEMDYVKETTGKLPAMRGMDYGSNAFESVNTRAKEWAAKGGLVTISWHVGYKGGGYDQCKNDTPDYEQLLIDGSDENKRMIKNWKKAAVALQELRDEGITVLWRPFHEFDGQWFWWGKDGEETFKKLWVMMYDLFTNEYELNNLIWVLGYTGEVKDGWYPGDEYCDVIGSDSYTVKTTNLLGWERLKLVSDAGKPLAFHECGIMPSLDSFEEDETMWAWFMIWNTEHITGNDPENLKEIYNSDKVITLDELPWYKG